MILYQKCWRAGSSFRGSQKIGEKGGVERKLSLGLVRSFFALSIRDNYLLFSLSTLGSYHWLRTIRLIRLQKTNSSLAPLPLRFAAKCEAPSLSTPRKASPPLWNGSSDVPRKMCPNVACHSHPVCRASDMLFNTVLLSNRAIGSNRPIGGSQPIGTRTRRAKARAERDHRTRRLRNENPMRNILKLNRQCCFKHVVSHICF